MQLLVIMEPVADDEAVALLTAMRRTSLIHGGSSSAELSEAEGAQNSHLLTSRVQW